MAEDNDFEDFKWQDYSACRELGTTEIEVDGEEVNGTNLFYDLYETDVVTALNTDKICLHCPVIKQCLKAGLNGNSEWGVWGGIYLQYGKIDPVKNAHKSISEWKELEEIHGRDFSEYYQETSQEA